MIVQKKVLRQRSASAPWHSHAGASSSGQNPQAASGGAGGRGACVHVRIHTPPRAPGKRGTGLGPGAGVWLRAAASRSRSPTEEMPGFPASNRPAIQDGSQVPVGRGAASGTYATGAVASRVSSIENTMLGIEGGRAFGVGGASAPAPSAPLQGAKIGIEGGRAVGIGGRALRLLRPRSRERMATPWRSTRRRRHQRERVRPPSRGVLAMQAARPHREGRALWSTGRRPRSRS